MAESQSHYFIERLKSMAVSDDRGALAALRRGLGGQPGTVPEMFPYVVPFLPENPPPWMENAYYLIAALFAYHPVSTDSGNMGTHLAQAARGSNVEATERRFVTLLSAHPDDLPGYLRQSLSLLKSKEIPVNWNQLFKDLQHWSHPDYSNQVRKRWATAFWRYQRLEQDITNDLQKKES